MSRLFYPILFGVTAALAATLWLRHGFSVQWLALVDVRTARAQALERAAPLERSGSPPPQAGSPNRAASATPAPVAAGKRAPSSLESLEISAPILMQSTKVVARIGTSDVILAGDIMPRVEEEFKRASPHYPPSQHEALREYVLRRVLQEAIDLKLIAADMKKTIPHDKLPDFYKDIDQQFSRHVVPMLMKQAKVKSESDFVELLKKQGSSLEVLKRDFIDNYLYNGWMKKEATDESDVSHEEMLRYYYEHFDEYRYAAKARFETLHASFKKHRDRQQAWRLICAMGNEVAGGRAFADVAKARSEGLHADRGGAWDWTTEGSLRSKALDTAVFSQPIGCLGGVLEDKSGFTIVRVIERQDAGVKSFRDTQAEIRKKIKDDRKEKHRKEALTKFLVKARPSAWTIFDDPPEMEQAAPPNQLPLRR